MDYQRGSSAGGSETSSLTTVSECFGLDEWMTCLVLQVTAPGLHQLLACDLVQNLVYLPGAAASLR